MRFRLPKFKTTAFALSLFFGIAVLMMFASFEVTSTPKFCGSCHIMKPYYESWKHSTHNTIACVECHIPPGVKGELQKKYEALSMVAKYFTVTYGPKPWAEVDDASCLRCHDRRLIAGKELFHGVLFDHAPHLTELRRGKKLRCTSCHSQIVQGSHITVTPSTCFLCHFKGQVMGESTTRCQLCHQIPEKTIVRDNIEFNHGDVKRFDMKCEWCHASVVSGDGDVPQNRCYMCHNEPARISEYKNTEKIHRVHVTERKVECLQCHNQIQHGVQKEIHAAESSCEKCHIGGHSPQRALYAGIGGKGVKPLPSPMYAAGIACEGCHFLPKKQAGDRIMVASEISCMACHGAKFNSIFVQWRTTTTDRLTKTREILQRVQSQLSPPYPDTFVDARANIELLEQAVPIHNVDYSLALMDESIDMLNATLKQKGKAPIESPWVKIPFQSKCLSCHQGIENQKGSYGGRPFIHYPHVVKNGVDCEICHEPHEIPPKQPPKIMDPSGCGDCHHDKQFANACKTCHENDIKKGVVVQGKVLDRKGLVFDHAMHMEATGKVCTDCHLLDGNFQRTPPAPVCADCHS